MSWKITKNSEPDFREDSFCGKCPRFEKEAIVTVYYSGRKQCKTDLSKTYYKRGMRCSLLDGISPSKFDSCMETCYLVPEKYF